MCKGKHSSTCYLNQCVLKHVSFSLMLHCNVSHRTTFLKTFNFWGFPGGTVVESPPANAGDTGSSPGLGRSHMPQSN